MSNENNEIDDEYMNLEQRLFFQKLLEEQRATIISEEARTKNYLQNERIPTADINDRATQEEEFAFELRIRNRESRLLQKINNALNRLKLQSYGWCEECGEAIGIPRLKARPTSELCIRCKEVAERRERRYRE